MNERIRELNHQALAEVMNGKDPDKDIDKMYIPKQFTKKFAELIVRECINREELLGAIARGWCSKKNSHKEMDSDLALAIFDEVEQHIRQQFGIK